VALTFQPVTPDRWADLERLFGPRGACGGCWCMFWRASRPDFARLKGEGNRARLRALVAAGEEPGVLAYEGAAPIGWCAVAPRASYPRLDRSRILAPVDDMPVWSVVCFYVERGSRQRGVTGGLLRAAADLVRRRGGAVLEGYPVEPADVEIPPVFAYTGLASAFLHAGFREVARRSPTRPIMRLDLRSGTGRVRARGTARPPRTARGRRRATGTRRARRRPRR
jgi:GNAT superfamily N-acetyltransferase